MLGGGWNLPHQHKVCCRSQSEQGLCAGQGSEEKTSVSPGIVSTSSKDDKTQGLSGRPFLERGMCRAELDSAQGSRVTIPGQHSVLQALSFVLTLGTGAVAAAWQPWCHARGRNSLALQRVGGDTRQVIPCQEGRWESLPLRGWGAVRRGFSCAQRGALPSHCGTAGAAPRC